MTDLARQTQAAQGRMAQGADRLAQITRTVQGTRNGVAAALADRIGPERFIRAAVTSIRTTPKLADCSEDSILGGLFIAAQLGLELGGPRGLVYLVPYGREASLVVGYRGFVDLFYKAGAKRVEWFLVREGDTFRIASDSRHGLGYHWQPLDLDDSRPYTGAVAQIETAAGGIVWEYMTRQAIEARRPAKWSGTPWKTWPEEMALKTVMRRLAKRAPVSTEVALAAEADETVQRRVEGIPEHVVEHVPVQGLPAGQETPQRREHPAPNVAHTPGGAAVHDPEGEGDWSPDERDALEWERQQQAEADAYLAEQGVEGEQ